ncbi:MarR family transcriptional regulator [Hwanghaeella grinnelliae]|uniref:MarR family transcriptional regulator n=1 Tax=Hwanghaeella grinnelliae TaxID=2500179 RepID=A0A437QH60_9PROT|nr:MarR family transcriptional regulator [Hwanghaeella grinnelliae]RVU33881.1 MarR family transcriptional regulator [Hwanghaeella grinnelliae]
MTENKLGALWSVLDAAMSQAFDDASPSTVAAILTLHFHAPLTGTRLSRILGLSQPATVRLLEKLRDAGLTRRHPKRDGKDIDISLTAAGEARAATLLGRRNAALKALLAPLSAEKAALLSTLLDEILPQEVASRADARFLCRFCDHEICDGAVCPIGCKARDIETAGKEAAK